MVQNTHRHCWIQYSESHISSLTYLGLRRQPLTLLISSSPTCIQEESSVRVFCQSLTTTIQISCFQDFSTMTSLSKGLLKLLLVLYVLAAPSFGDTGRPMCTHGYLLNVRTLHHYTLNPPVNMHHKFAGLPTRSDGLLNTPIIVSTPYRQLSVWGPAEVSSFYLDDLATRLITFAVLEDNGTNGVDGRCGVLHEE